MLNAQEIFPSVEKGDLLGEPYVKKIPGLIEGPSPFDRVQLVGSAGRGAAKGKLLEGLASVGVYRVTPFADMYMRSSVEPYDGMNLAEALTFAMEGREMPVLPERAT
jgi:hypothetical protein